MNDTISLNLNSSGVTNVIMQINDTSDYSIQCPSFTDQDEIVLNQFKYWIGGIGVCIVSITGLLLNVVAVLALLTRLSNHNNFNQLMVILFLVDSLYLILKIISTLQRQFGWKTRALVIIYPHFTYPVSSISLTLSIFLTVGMAHERHVAIKHPIQHRQRMISAKFRRISLLKYMVSIILCAVSFNVPKFFEAELVWQNKTGVSDIINTTERYSNDSLPSYVLEPSIRPTDMRMNPYYSIYYINPATFLVLGIFPLTLLAYWNFNIYKQIKSVSSWVHQNANQQPSSRNQQENELARVLIGIVITFVCCHALRILLNFHEAITIKDTLACHAIGQEGIPLWPQVTNEFSKLMLVTNSSANIIIYCCLNSNFRKNILTYLKRSRNENANQALGTNNTTQSVVNIETTQV